MGLRRQTFMADSNLIKPFIENLRRFNETIREKVQANNFGIYIWANSQNEDVIYIDMAGKIKINGAFYDHPLWTA